ncbi:MAG: ArsB/NhaD family transporter, partial [Spirulinaceae cyanobacterium]
TLASMGTGFTAALLSSLSNNLPVAVVNNLALQEATADQSAIPEAMLYANLIGTSLGAKLIPWGSLSTLLWLDILRRKGLNLFWGHYFRIHIALTIPVLFICFLMLALWLPWLVV